MPGVAVDTHSLVWFLLRSPRLSHIALGRMRDTIARGEPLHVPTVCLVELVYLIEKGRLPLLVQDRIDAHLNDPDSGLELAPLDRNVANAIRRVPRDQVPDMPDRIIGATALSLGVPLVTRDGLIKAAGIETVW